MRPAQIKIDGSVENYFANPRLNLWSAVTHRSSKLRSGEFHRISAGGGNLVRFRCAHIARHTERYLHPRDRRKARPGRHRRSSELCKAQGRSSVNANLKTSEILLDLFLPPSPRPTAKPIINQSEQSWIDGARWECGLRPRWSNDPIGIAIPSDIDADVKLEMVALTKNMVKLEQPLTSCRFEIGPSCGQLVRR